MDLLHTRKGETDLAYVKGQLYLLVVCDVEEPARLDVDGTLGIDLGIQNRAVDSDGNIDSGKTVLGVLRRRLRTKL